MKKTLIISITFIIIMSFWFVRYAGGEEQKNESINITVTDYPERTVTSSHSFEMSAGVAPNECNTCIKYMNPSECLVVCEQIVYYDNSF